MKFTLHRQRRGSPSSGPSHDTAFQRDLAEMVQPFDVLAGRPGIDRHRAYAMVRLADQSGL